MKHLTKKNSETTRLLYKIKRNVDVIFQGAGTVLAGRKELKMENVKRPDFCHVS